MDSSISNVVQSQNIKIKKLNFGGQNNNMRLLLICFIFISLSLPFQAQEVLEGKLLAQWFQEDIPGSFAFDNAYNEIWGFAINDHEYAILGSSLGTHFIDVTDTDNVFEAYFIEGKESNASIIHRDYHDNNGFLYAVADEGVSSLQIIDLRFLPDSISVAYDSAQLLSTSHNIFIDEEQDRLYSCAHNGVWSGYSALRVFDISDPLHPIDLLGTNTFENFQVGHVHDAYVKDHIAYLNCGNDGFAIVDMTNVDSLVLLGFLESDDYPQSGYNHSGWLTEEGDIYYMADENHGLDIKTLDVSEYSEVETVSTFDVGLEFPTAIPHNLIVQGDLLYASYYYNGLQVYDISDRVNPKRIMHYPTSSLPNGTSYEGAWGVYPFLPSGNILVSDMQEGLFVIEDVSSTVSASNQALEVFEIFPNPVSDFIQIQLVEEGNYQYSIKNIAGQVISNGKINSLNTSLNIEGIPNGSYFIELNNGKELYSQKFVVTK